MISPVVTLLGVPVWDGSLTLYIYYQLPSDWSVKSNCKNGKDVSRAQGKRSNIICKKVSHICQISKKTEPLLLHSWIYCQHFQTWRSCETVNRKQGNRTDYAKSLSVKSRETGKKNSSNNCFRHQLCFSYFGEIDLVFVDGIYKAPIGCHLPWC